MTCHAQISLKIELSSAKKRRDYTIS